jgi:hypothetical protein
MCGSSLVHGGYLRTSSGSLAMLAGVFGGTSKAQSWVADCVFFWVLAVRRIHQQYGERILAIAVSGLTVTEKHRLMARSSGACLWVGCLV